MISQKQLYEVWNSRMDFLTHTVDSLLRSDWFDLSFKDEFLSDVQIKVYNSPKAKSGFNDETHLIRYTLMAIKKYAKFAYLNERKRRDGEPLPVHKMMQNYNLAKSIIDSHRRA